ncbi:MAG: nucleotidyltransferase family protein [Candidatus Thorarchaeota archaeon]
MTSIKFPTKERFSIFCKQHHIKKLSVFGSVLRDDFGPDSDIDVLIEFEPDSIPGFFELIEMEEELSELFGRKVDIRTPKGLSRYFRDEVLESAEVQFIARR